MEEQSYQETESVEQPDSKTESNEQSDSNEHSEQSSEQHEKRKYMDGEDDEEGPSEKRRTRSIDERNSIAEEIPSEHQTIVEMMECPVHKVGIIIGTKGAIVNEMMRRTGCKISVKQDMPEGEPRQVVFTGIPACILAAKELVCSVIEHGPSPVQAPQTCPSSQAEVEVSEMPCPEEKVKHVIGAKGAVIQEIMKRSGCKVVINQDMEKGLPRIAIFTGRPQQILEAKALVTLVIAQGTASIGALNTPSPAFGMGGGYPGGGMGGMGGGGRMQSNYPDRDRPRQMSNIADSSAPITHQELDVAQDKVAQVIGARGVVIQAIMKHTGCKIRINQDVPAGEPRKAQFTGTNVQIGNAMVLVATVITNGSSAVQNLMDVPGGHSGVGGGSNAVVQEINILQSQMGKLIGTGGETIKRVQSSHSVTIKVSEDMYVLDQRVVKIVGEQHNVQAALQTVLQILEFGPDAVWGPDRRGPGAPSGTFYGSQNAPQHSMPQYGRGGGPQQQTSYNNPHMGQPSNASYNASYLAPPPHQQQQPTYAPQQQQQQQQQLPPPPAGGKVLALGADGQAGQLYPMTSLHDGQFQQLAFIQPQSTGRVVGKQAATLGLIKNKSGASIVVDKAGVTSDGRQRDAGDLSKVVMTGSESAVALCAQMVQEVLSNGPSRLNEMPDVPMTAVNYLERPSNMAVGVGPSSKVRT